MAEIWFELSSDVNLSVSDPVENVTPETSMSTGDSNPSASESRDISPVLTYPLVGTIAYADVDDVPMSIVTDLDPSEDPTTWPCSRFVCHA